jgi:hypothetical protein
MKFVGFEGQTGKHSLGLSLTGFDPKTDIVTSLPVQEKVLVLPVCSYARVGAGLFPA